MDMKHSILVSFWYLKEIYINIQIQIKYTISGGGGGADKATKPRTLGCFGSVMVSVLAVERNICGFRGFKPIRGDGFLREIKIRSTPSFGGELKPLAPCR
jgi:hypothetical protein